MNITINEKPSAQSYLESLANKLSNCFNSVAFKTSCGTEARYFRFHRKGENAKTIQVPTLANRSVKLNLQDKSQNGRPTIITHKQGSLVVSKPCKEGLMLSAAIEINDSEVSGHITDLSLQQEIATVVETINDTLNKEILGLIEESEDFEKLVKVMPETSSGTGLKARGEAYKKQSSQLRLRYYLSVKSFQITLWDSQTLLLLPLSIVLVLMALALFMK